MDTHPRAQAGGGEGGVGMLKRVISTEKIPVKLWLDDLEAGAEAQARNVANLPFAFRHVAIMPDGHQGYGMPIGGVLAAQGAVIPNAVGVDIGCGMCSVRTDLTEIDTESLKRIMGRIRATIPVGFEHQKEAQDEALMPALFCSLAEFHGDPITRQQYRPALCQIGTLGGRQPLHRDSEGKRRPRLGHDSQRIAEYRAEGGEARESKRIQRLRISGCP